MGDGLLGVMKAGYECSAVCHAQWLARHGICLLCAIVDERHALHKENVRECILHAQDRAGFKKGRDASMMWLATLRSMPPRTLNNA